MLKDESRAAVSADQELSAFVLPAIETIPKIRLSNTLLFAVGAPIVEADEKCGSIDSFKILEIIWVDCQKFLAHLHERQSN